MNFHPVVYELSILEANFEPKRGEINTWNTFVDNGLTTFWYGTNKIKVGESGERTCFHVNINLNTKSMHFYHLLAQFQYIIRKSLLVLKHWSLI